MSFKFDDGEIERLVREAAAVERQDVARQMERVIADLTRQHYGKAVGEIKPMLTAAFTSFGWELSEPDLTKYATYISEGRRIKIEPDVS